MKETFQWPKILNTKTNKNKQKDAQADGLYFKFYITWRLTVWKAPLKSRSICRQVFILPNVWILFNFILWALIVAETDPTPSLCPDDNLI